MRPDLELVDEYLANWDRFAQGENQLAATIRSNQAEFEAALTRLLQSQDKRAPARLVFYAVVQIGGFVPTESNLGKAIAELLGPEFPVTQVKGSMSAYFAGDLFLWWEKNHAKFESYPLFEEWCVRDFGRTVVIPQYRQVSKPR